MEGAASLSGGRRQARTEGMASLSGGRRKARMEGRASLSGGRRKARVEGGASLSGGRRQAWTEGMASLSGGRRKARMEGQASFTPPFLRSSTRVRGMPRKSSLSSAAWSKVTSGKLSPRNASVGVGGGCRGRAESCGRRGGSVPRRPRRVRGRGIGDPGATVPGRSMATKCNEVSDGVRGAGRRRATRPPCSGS